MSISIANPPPEAKQTARKLAASAIGKGYKPTALYIYTNSSGESLYYRIRCDKEGEKWIRPMCKKNEAFVLGEPGFEKGQKPLYGLHNVLSADVVFIVEGEKCADGLMRLGVVAVTSGGASSADDCDLMLLQGKDVRLWADNDEAGVLYIQKLCQRLEGVAKRIKLIDIAALNLPEKGDCADWLEANPNVTEEDVFALPLQDYSSLKGSAFRVSEQGVYFTDKEGVKHLVCEMPLYIDAMTYAKKTDSNFGKLLRFKNLAGHEVKITMPLDVLQSDGKEFRAMLANRGFNCPVGRTERRRLMEYVSSYVPSKELNCVNSFGWEGDTYILKDRSFGGGGLTIYQGTQPAFEVSGTVVEWRENVAKLCSGNSRYMFSVSCAFASAITSKFGGESGGFHFVGSSSHGKSTATKVAASVWSNPTGYWRSWRATDNGLEGAALKHNDGLLILDEFKQATAKNVGHIVYMISNGQGKSRGKVDGTAKDLANWNVVFLSSGELTLQDRLAEAGEEMTAGQSVRFNQINSDAGQKMGMIEALHGFASAKVFAEEIERASSRYYGSAIVEFLNVFVSKKSQWGAYENRLRAIRQELCADEDGQSSRIAKHFAMVVLGGELATQYGLTGWQSVDVLEAVKRCYCSALEQRGGKGSLERQNTINGIKDFIDRHGSSRFQSLNGADDKVSNRAGYVDEALGLYLFNTSGFKEAIGSISARDARKYLDEIGCLEKNKTRGFQYQKKLGGVSNNFTAIRFSRLQSQSHEKQVATVATFVTASNDGACRVAIQENKVATGNKVVTDTQKVVTAESLDNKGLQGKVATVTTVATQKEEFSL